MKISGLLWTLVLLLFMIVPSSSVKSTNSNRLQDQASQIIVEGKAPYGSGKAMARSVANAEEYYGIDYDCDGFGDFVYGSPFSTVDGKKESGSVNVVYGTGTGLKKTGNELWSLASLGLSVQGGEGFGFSMVSADIDDDGCTELIVGSPGRDSGAGINSGAVYVIKGSKQGLQQSGFQELLGEDEFDLYGWSITGGDFNNDDSYDIAGGAVNHQVGTKPLAGAVYVDYGPSLSPNSRQIWSLNSPGIRGKAAVGDMWGYSLTTGNFNGDAFDDLVIGAPFGKVRTNDDAGFVNILYGGNGGLKSGGSQLIRLTMAETGDELGFALNTCYCNSDGFEDLLFSSTGRFDSEGIVFLVFGSGNGVVSTAGQALVDPDRKQGDRFGNSIATIGTTGKFGIYIGSPGADVEIGSQVRSDAGAISIFGTVTPGVYEFKDRNIGTALKLPRKAGDAFGSSLSVTANENRYTTLLISVPRADVGGKDNAGAALSYRVDLNNYTKLTNPLTWDRGRLAGAPEKDGFFAFRMGLQVKF